MGYGFGYVPSFTWDFCGGSMGGGLNLMMNAAYEHNKVYPFLGWTPNSSANFSLYSDPSSMNIGLLNPMSAAKQTWNNGNWSSIFAGGFNGPTGNNWGGFNWGNSGVTTSGSTPETEEGRVAKNKYDALLPIIDDMIKNGKLGSKLKSKLEQAKSEAAKSKDKDGENLTWEKKFEILEKAYKEVPVEKRKNFIIDRAHAIGVDGKLSNTNSLDLRLLEIGYERTGKGADDKVQVIKNSLDNIKGNQATALEVLGVINSTQYEILDIISSYNSTFKDSGNLISYAIKKIKDVDNDPDGTAKTTAFTQSVQPLCSKLLDKARELVTELDSTSGSSMQNAIDNLTKSLGNSTGTNIDDSLEKDFNTLYVLCRKVALAKLQSDLKDYYGEVDSELFNDNLFKDNLDSDLANEGLGNIDTGDIKLGDGTSVGTTGVDTNLTGQAAADELVRKGVLKEVSVSYNGLKTYCTKNEIGDKYKYYVVDKDGQLKELTGATYSNDGWSGGTVNTSVANITDISKEHDNAQKSATYTCKSDDKLAAQVLGAQVAKNLDGYTNGNEWAYVHMKITGKDSILNSKNIFEFLGGYINNDLGDEWCEFFEQVDDENDDKKEKAAVMKRVTELVVENLKNRISALEKDDDLDPDFGFTRLRMQRDVDSLQSILSECNSDIEKILDYGDEENLDDIINKYSKKVKKHSGYDKAISGMSEEEI